MVELVWHMGVRVMHVEELNGMESAAVDIKMDIPAVEIRGAGFPNFYLRMHRLDGLPDGLSDALTLNTDLHIEKCQFASMLVSFNNDDSTTHAPTVNS